MKKIYLVLAILLTLAGKGSAQVTISSVSSCTAYTLTATLTGLTPVNSGLYSDDSYSGVIPIGFTFNYYGTPYTQLVIGENGQLTFDPSLAGGYDPWPISAALLGNSSALNTVCAPWCDIESTGPPADPIVYSVQGVAPNRTFAATWCRDHMFSCTAQYTTTQIILYETTGVVEAHIGHKTVCAGWNGGYAIVGVQNASGSSATVAPGRDYPSVWTATNEAWRFTPVGGTTYTVSSIPYAPIPYAASAIYWYNTTTGAYLGSGATVVVSPTSTTTYEAAAVGCDDTSMAYITLGPVSGGATGTVTGPTAMCLGSGVTLTDATPGGTWSSGAPGVATVDATGHVTSVSGGTATISYTNGPCTSTLIVTVNIAPPITGTTTLCVGGTSTLADGVTGGTWTSSTPGVATIGLSSGLLTGVTAGTSMITYVTPAGCVTTTPVNIVVLTPVSGTKTVCMGSTTSLSDPGAGAGGTWTSSATGVATIGAGTGIVTGVSGGTSNITYTSAGGCFVSTTVTVNPTSPITGVMSMCQNFTTTLGDAIAGGAWTSNNPSVATVNSATGVVTGLTGGNATIVYTLPTGCAVTALVTVNPKPTPPVPSAPFSYCQFAIAGPVTASGTGLLWYGPGVTGGMATGPTPSTSLPGTTTYYVTQTTSFGCVSDSATDVITIIPQPAAPITHDTVYCQYYNGFILPPNWEVDSAAASFLRWYSGAGSALAGAPTPSTATPDYPGGTTWNVSQVVNGCESPQAPIKVTIIPTPKFNMEYRNWVCQHDSIDLSYNLTGSVLIAPVYLWQLPVGASTANGTNVNDPSVTVKYDSANVTYNIGYLTIGNLNGECSTTDTFTVRVVPEPSAQSYSKQDVCQGDTVNLAISSQSSNAANFFWQIDGTPMTSSPALNIVSSNSNSGGPFSISWNIIGPHIISLVTTTTEGCTNLPEFDTVNVHALPNATFTIVPSKTGTLCLEDSVLFKAALQDANVTYLWQPEHDFNNNNKAEIWGKAEQGRTDITLTVTDPFGCKSSSDMQLSPDACCTVLFPTAFSPNGDGHNDRFQPIFNGYHNFHEFRVVNRWGQTVFESANSNPSWDGGFNGVPQDMGVYYYFIKYDCGGNTIEERGDVTLVR